MHINSNVIPNNLKIIFMQHRIYTSSNYKKCEVMLMLHVVAFLLTQSLLIIIVISNGWIIIGCIMDLCNIHTRRKELTTFHFKVRIYMSSINVYARKSVWFICKDCYVWLLQVIIGPKNFPNINHKHKIVASFVSR